MRALRIAIAALPRLAGCAVAPAAPRAHAAPDAAKRPPLRVEVVLYDPDLTQAPDVRFALGAVSPDGSVLAADPRGGAWWRGPGAYELAAAHAERDLGRARFGLAGASCASPSFDLVNGSSAPIFEAPHAEIRNARLERRAGGRWERVETVLDCGTGLGGRAAPRSRPGIAARSWPASSRGTTRRRAATGA